MHQVVIAGLHELGLNLRVRHRVDEIRPDEAGGDDRDANREALLLAVYRHDVQAVIDAAPALLAAHPPGEALRLWFDRLVCYGRIKHGVAQAVEAATRADLSGEYYDQVIAAITLLLDAGQQEGVVRPDVDADEVLLLVGFLWRIDNPDWEPRLRHLLTLVMDALRGQSAGSRMPNPHAAGPSAEVRVTLPLRWK